MPHNVKTRDAALSPNVVVAAIVALVLIGAALAVGSEVAGIDSNSTPIVTTVVGLFAPTIIGLLALLKAEKVDRKTDAVNDKVNGHLSALTDAAIAAGVRPEDLPPAPPDVPARPGQAGGNGDPAA